MKPIMKRGLYLWVVPLLLCLNTLAQQSRYTDDLFPGSDTMTLVYGTNVNYINQPVNLLIDYYLPRGDSDQNRAAVIFVHGGGFRSGHRNNDAILELCSKLARKGFVAASIDYRTGLYSDSETELSAAIVRSVQDLNAAIRFTRAHAGLLGIDTNLIFISGASSGGITVLQKAFLKPDSTALMLGVSSLQALEAGTNFLPNSSDAAGVFSLWGAVFDTSWITASDLPVGCVHSEADSTIPYITGYNRRNGAMKLYGSLPIVQRARGQGLFTMLHTFQSGKHDLGLKVAPYKDTTVQLMCAFFRHIIDQRKHIQSSNGFRPMPGAMLNGVSVFVPTSDTGGAVCDATKTRMDAAARPKTINTAPIGAIALSSHTEIKTLVTSKAIELWQNILPVFYTETN